MEELEEDMKPKLIGETWRKYPTETSMQKATYGLFECQYCKKEFECIVQSVKSGSTKSCGCFTTKLNTTHGISQNKFYNTWKHMVDRCTNPKIKAYKDYGGRGISVCEEWLNIRNFVDWCDLTHPNMEGYTLDRINNDKGYSPENCTWSDKTTQAINKRRMKNNKSGFVGVCWDKKTNKWRSSIVVDKKYKYIKMCETEEEAVGFRDQYIIDNHLPHKLSHQYIKEK